MPGYVFISYSSTDRAYVDRLAAHLRAAGVQVWYDYELDTGDRFTAVIQHQIDGCAAVLVVMTPTAMDSRWVDREISYADHRGKPLLSLMLAAAQDHFLLFNVQREDVTSGRMPGDRFITRLRGAAATSAVDSVLLVPQLVGTGRVSTWGHGRTLVIVAAAQAGTRALAVPAGLAPAVAIAAGEFHSVALHANGAITAWGNNDDGQTTVPAGLGPAVAIAARGRHSLALHTDGTIAAWGNNDYGQTTVPAALAPAAAIAAGDWHSLALHTDGTVTAWGYNRSGQATVPVGLAPAVAIAAGGGHSLALT